MELFRRLCSPRTSVCSRGRDPPVARWKGWRGWPDCCPATSDLWCCAWTRWRRVSRRRSARWAPQLGAGHPDFFVHEPVADQPVWNRLFVSENSTASSAHPHIELQLKLLYTAVTRSYNRLLFMEICNSSLSSTVLRWMVGSGIAEMFIALDQTAVLLTSDEWRVQGNEFALTAEGDSTVMFLQKAVRYRAVELCHSSA